MRELFSMDKHDYDPALPRFVRPSVRAIIRRGGKVAMEHVTRYGYYKFPGGGIDTGETQLETLCRETREEAGLVVRPETAKPYGMVPRIRLSKDGGHIFEQMNYYYLCDVLPDPVPTDRDAYEIEEGFTLEWADPKAVIDANLAADAKGLGWGMPWREAQVLQMLQDEGYFA